MVKSELKSGWYVVLDRKTTMADLAAFDAKTGTLVFGGSSDEYDVKDNRWVMVRWLCGPSCKELMWSDKHERTDKDIDEVLDRVNRKTTAIHEAVDDLLQMYVDRNGGLSEYGKVTDEQIDEMTPTQLKSVVIQLLAIKCAMQM